MMPLSEGELNVKDDINCLGAPLNPSLLWHNKLFCYFALSSSDNRSRHVYSGEARVAFNTTYVDQGWQLHDPRLLQLLLFHYVYFLSSIIFKCFFLELGHFMMISCVCNSFSRFKAIWIDLLKCAIQIKLSYLPPVCLFWKQVVFHAECGTLLRML